MHKWRMKDSLSSVNFRSTYSPPGWKKETGNSSDNQPPALQTCLSQSTPNSMGNVTAPVISPAGSQALDAPLNNEGPLDTCRLHRADVPVSVGVLTLLLSQPVCPPDIKVPPTGNSRLADVTVHRHYLYLINSYQHS